MIMYALLPSMVLAMLVVGFLGGYFLGPLPASAWETPAAQLLIAALSALGLNQAVNELSAGYADLATMDALFSLAPFLLTPRQMVQVLENRYSTGPQLLESNRAAVLADGEVSAVIAA